MKLQTLAFLMTSLVGAAIASAANFSWLGSDSPSDWTDGGNWFNLDTSTFGVAPAAGDLAIIGYVSADFNSTPRSVVNSVLYNAPDCEEFAFCGRPLKEPLRRTGGRGNGGFFMQEEGSCPRSRMSAIPA